jgi:metal-responsive CopG/Arc/MetJ family transcriptional regulator
MSIGFKGVRQMKKIHVGIMADATLVKKLRDIADREYRTLAALVRKILQEYVANNSSKK